MQALRGRGELAAVQPDDAAPVLVGEGRELVQQGGLADAARSMDMQDSEGRRLTGESGAEQLQLSGASDESSFAGGGEACPEPGRRCVPPSVSMPSSLGS